ncbi:ABC transporter permease subunit [Rhizobiaceae bacterium]|nr:ABC transporter permease subunit [Rhizobiaceae bacterium]
MANSAYVATALAPSRPAPPGIARVWTGTRVAGTLLCALWVALAGAMIWYFVAGYESDFVGKYAPRLLNGLWLTIWITLVSIGLGLLLAGLLTAMRLSSSALLRGPAAGFMAFFRGTPLIAQVFLIYYGTGQFSDALKAVNLWWFFREALYCAVLAFTLNTAAYQAQIYIGAIRDVPKGQREAAMTLGLRPGVVFWKIVLPQAAITALRPLGNEIVLMVKGSAIASVITVLDLMGETRLAYSRTFDFQIYLWAACLYLVLVEVLRRVWDVLEARLTRHLKR